jgi:integral membrane protein
MVYVVTALVLAYQARWRPGWTLLVLLAGTVPFASFVAERKVVAAVRRERTPADV